MYEFSANSFGGQKKLICYRWKIGSILAVHQNFFYRFFVCICHFYYKNTHRFCHFYDLYSFKTHYFTDLADVECIIWHRLKQNAPQKRRAWDEGKSFKRIDLLLSTMSAQTSFLSKSMLFYLHLDGKCAFFVQIYTFWPTFGRKTKCTKKSRYARVLHQIAIFLLLFLHQIAIFEQHELHQNALFYKIWKFKTHYFTDFGDLECTIWIFLGGGVKNASQMRCVEGRKVAVFIRGWTYKL